jgi:Cu2+-exporting ATPase
MSDHAHHHHEIDRTEGAAAAPAHRQGPPTHEHTGKQIGGSHEAHRGNKPGRHDHHAHGVADFRRRFLVSLILTVPVLALAPMIQRLLGLREALAFPGDSYVQFVFASIVFFHGGWPFLEGFFAEIKKKTPGMMTLIAVAICVAYFCSAAVVFGLS